MVLGCFYKYFSLWIVLAIFLDPSNINPVDARGVAASTLIYFFSSLFIYIFMIIRILVVVFLQLISTIFFSTKVTKLVHGF